MLVPSMTDFELRDEVIEDFLESVGKMHLKICYQYTSDRKKVNKQKTYSRGYKRKSKRKNTWLFICRKANESKRFKSAVDVSINCLTYYYNKKSFRVFKLVPDDDGVGIKGVAIYNSHVFKRYAERMGMSFNDPLAVVKTFFINNGIARIGYTEENKVIGVCKEGLLLGRINATEGIIVHNTFILKEQMFNQQTQMEKELKEQLEEEISVLSFTSTLNTIEKLRYNYRLDALLELW